jgi:CRP-like cAMP-binding protein
MFSSAYTQLSSFLQAIIEIPENELQKLTYIFNPLSLSAGRFFIRTGEVPTQIGFVASGILRLYYVNDRGVEFTKSFCQEKDFVAAYSALILNKPAQFFIEALEDSLLLVADYQNYQRLCTEHPCWEIIKHRFVEDLFIKKEKREGELLLDDATTRYKKFLMEYPTLENQVKQYHIASYLGISPVSLSRIRKTLKGQ